MGLNPGYKQTDAGLIPNDWDALVVQDVIDRFFCGPSPTCEERNIVGDDEWGVLKTTAITWGGGWDWTRHKTLPKSYWNQPKLAVKAGDVIVTKAGPRHRVGVTAWVNDCPSRIIVSGKMIGLRPNPKKAVPLVLAAAIATTKAQRFLDQRTTGMAESQVNFENGVLLNAPIAMPPLAQQEAIAKVLGDMAAFVESLKQLLNKKRLIKKGAMQELLTGRKRLPGFNGNWTVRRLGDVVDTDPENLTVDTPPSLTFNYIALEDVDVGTLSSYSEQMFRTAPSRARRKLRKDDVLVATVRPNLMSHLLFAGNGDDWVCSTGFCVVRCRVDISHPGYVYYHLFAGPVTRQIETLLTGSNYPAISSGDVRALEIPFPEYEEQVAITAVLSDMDAEIAALEAKLAKTRQVKQGMTQELLTGKIRLEDSPRMTGF